MAIKISSTFALELKDTEYDAVKGDSMSLEHVATVFKIFGGIQALHIRSTHHAPAGGNSDRKNCTTLLLSVSLYHR